MEKEILEAIKQGNTKKFYKNKIWINKRTEIIKRDNKECQKCKKRGKYSRAEVVHHIKHLRDFPYLAIEDSNLISLCNSCHNEEHPEKLITKEISKVRKLTKERW